MRLLAALYRRKHLLCYLVLLAVLGLLACDVSISLAARVYRDPTEVPHHEIALVLGTAPRYANKPNSFYVKRLDAAALLYHEGRVDGFLLSGDNGREDYNEPDQMKKDLIERGVPAEYITCDYAGFSTSDSIVRAKEVFGLDEFVVVSQGFHAERAVFMARNHGISAVAFAALDAPLKPHMKIRSREILSRALAVTNLVWPREPRFLGPRLSVRSRD